MISLKKYLDQAHAVPTAPSHDAGELLPATIAAYRSALQEIGSCSMDACPALGDGLRRTLNKIGEDLSSHTTREDFEASEQCIQEQLQDWGRDAAKHYQQQTGDVKEILIVMARTAESVGDRDKRCARQINEVTARLQRIANLEDLTQIRASIVRSAKELKTSIDKMAAEGKAAIEQLRTEVSTYQTKLEEAELIATRDSLTRLRSRSWVESQIERRIASKLPLCVAIIDMDGFKQVNDDHGHLAGDELLKQFSAELKSACRASDIIGRWGGDEFIILLDCALPEAQTQTDRLRQWVCGDYTLQGQSGPTKLRVDASIGLAEHIPEETMKQLIARADAAMYQHKNASRSKTRSAKR
jgi:diguanylate cyclase (GGDEF)-like protein